MDKLFASKVFGKSVVDADGEEIGSVSDVISDDSGNLLEVWVSEAHTPPGDGKSGNSSNTYLDYPKEGGVYKIPISAVQSARDHIIVK